MQRHALSDARETNRGAGQHRRRAPAPPPRRADRRQRAISLSTPYVTARRHGFLGASWGTFRSWQSVLNCLSNWSKREVWAGCRLEGPLRVAHTHCTFMLRASAHIKMRLGAKGIERNALGHSGGGFSPKTIRSSTRKGRSRHVAVGGAKPGHELPQHVRGIASIGDSTLFVDRSGQEA
jgi:hypothetical protein